MLSTQYSVLVALGLGRVYRLLTFERYRLRLEWQWQWHRIDNRQPTHDPPSSIHDPHESARSVHKRHTRTRTRSDGWDGWDGWMAMPSHLPSTIYHVP